MRRTALRLGSCVLAAVVTVLVTAPAASALPKTTDVSDRKAHEVRLPPLGTDPDDVRGRKLG